MFPRTLRLTVLALALGASSVDSSAEGLKVDGLRTSAGIAPSDHAAWPRWQARMGVTGGSASRPLVDVESARAVAVLGDYYFTSSGFDPSRVGGGVRATTGWLYGGNSALDVGGTSTGRAVSFWRGPGGDDAPSRHGGYIGIGYTGVMTKLGLGFSADFGLIGSTLSPVNQRQDYDVTVREIRLAPTVRLGVSYAF